MKKYICMIFSLWLAACANRVNKTEFVNPIFYQPLRPLSMADGYVYLTPTSIDMRTPKDKNLVAGKGECELTENTQAKITLKCKYQWIPKEGELEFLKNLLNSPNASYRSIAKTSLEGYATTYESYFTYTVKNLFLEDCLGIQEEIIRTGKDQLRSQGNYCVTPPDKLKSD